MNIHKLKRITSEFLRFLLLAVLALFFLVPICLILFNAFKPGDLVMSSPLSLPIPPNFDSIISIINNKTNSVLPMYKNSITLLVCVLPVSVVINSLASYYLARNKSKLSAGLRMFFMAGLMVPYVIVFIPLALVVRTLHIPYGVPVLACVFISSTVPFSTFMFTNFIQTIPKELEEAAAIDGASKMYTFWKIVFPLLKPCTATILIFNGLGVWNDFQTPLLMGQIKTITVGIYTAIGPYSADWGLVFGYLLFAVVPIIIVYILLQKEFVAGLTAGATKG